MMVPTQLGLIPLYMLMVKLGVDDTLHARSSCPFLVNGFGVFMMRQYASQAVPDELIEAARVDGCSTFRIYWSVVLPALRPAAAVLGLLTFMADLERVPVAVRRAHPGEPDRAGVAAASCAAATTPTTRWCSPAPPSATLPLLVVFVLFGRQIIGGIMEGAVKA